MYDGVFGGASLYTFNTTETGVNACNEFLSTYIQRPESIVNMYMCPKMALGLSTTVQDGGLLANTFRGQKTTVTDAAITSTSDFEGYQPVNKKLLTYPYNFYTVDDGNGSSLQLRYEFFENNQPKISVETCVTSPVQVKLVPQNYKHVGDRGDQTEFLTLAGYPLCSWNTDTFRAWVAQNSVPMGLKIGGALLGLGVGLATGGIGLAVGAVSAVGLVSSTVSQAYDASIDANLCKGNISSGNVGYSNKELHFNTGRAHITRQQAIVIDNYFKMFGYAQNKIYKPSTRVRPHYTYIKTIGCKLKGECSNAVINKIASIFDNGITFWRNPSEIGNYSVDNRPTA